jgi:hypothetical protein
MTLWIPGLNLRESDSNGFSSSDAILDAPGGTIGAGSGFVLSSPGRDGGI